MSGNLNNILRLTLGESVEKLSGGNTENVQVDWICDSVRSAQPGDLVLVYSRELKASSFAEAAERKIAALVVLGEKPNFSAKKMDDVAVYHVKGEYDRRAVHRQMMTVLLHQRMAIMEHGFRVYNQLTKIATEGEGLRGLAKAIAEISGKGVLIQDKRGGILGESPSSAVFSIWGNLLLQLEPLSSLPEALLDRKNAGVKAGIVSKPIPGGLLRLIHPIIVGDVVRGYLSLVGIENDFDTLDSLVLEQGSIVCGVEMAREKAVREAEKRLKGDLLTALLQENLSPRDAQLWLQTMGFDLDQGHVALRFMWDSENAPSRRRLETLIHGEVARLGYQLTLDPMGVEVICFLEVPPEEGRPTKAIELGKAVIDQAEREYPEKVVRCGIGGTALDLSEWQDSFRQAGQALAMARRFGEKRPVYFTDLSVYRLLLQMEHNPELISFQEQTLGKLLVHEGYEEMIHTLDAFFAHHGNLSQTADALFIHRNTLNYRLERIQSILGIDLDNPETRLALQLALHIYRMKGL